MASDLDTILKLEVPVIVVLGERTLPLHDVVGLAPGAIIELPKPADAELELRVNNKPVGIGRAVKVGENFGIRLSFVGNLKDRVMAMGAQAAGAPGVEPVEAASGAPT